MIAHSNSGKRTPGEELYLVHLRRLREEEDDHDHLPRKRRSSSVGEELWEIHKRRSQGMEGDSDRDTDESVLLDKREDPKKFVAASGKKKCRYNLRSKDAPDREKTKH